MPWCINTMKTLIATIVGSVLILTATAQEVVKVHSKADLAWTHEFPEGLSQFILRAYPGTNGTTVAASATVPAIGGIWSDEFKAYNFTSPILTLMGASQNGVYTVKCFAQDLSATESDPSNPLYLFWYGIPAAPGRPYVISVKASPSTPPTP